MPKTGWKNTVGFGANKHKSSPVLPTAGRPFVPKPLSSDTASASGSGRQPSSTSSVALRLANPPLKKTEVGNTAKASSAYSSVTKSINKKSSTGQFSMGIENRNVDVVDGNVNRAIPPRLANETVEPSPGNSSGNCSKPRFTDYLAAENLDFNVMRNLFLVPVVRDGVDSGVYYDSFRLPDSFAKEEFPPPILPPTPVANPESVFAYHEPGPNKEEISKRNREADKARLRKMEALLDDYNRKREAENERRRRLGIPLAGDESDDEDGDGASDLNSSFILEYTPSPVVAPGKVVKRSNSISRAERNYTPAKRSKMSAVSEGTFRSSFASACTPTSSVSNDTLNTDSTTSDGSHKGRPTRLFNDTEEELSLANDEQWSSDDEMLSQMDLVALESASAQSQISGTIIHSLVEAQTGPDIDGVGFEEEDGSEDFIFSQISY